MNNPLKPSACKVDDRVFFIPFNYDVVCIRVFIVSKGWPVTVTTAPLVTPAMKSLIFKSNNDILIILILVNIKNS